MTKIIILGKNGQVGWELYRNPTLRGEILSLGKGDGGGDLMYPHKVAQNIIDYCPDIVFNAAAYTAVDQAENNKDLAFSINATAVKEIALACQHVGAILVHYSTDYVFDGSGIAPRSEEAQTGPINVYGHSKLAGEQIIKEFCPQSFIFRTSWVYGLHVQNFIKTILRLAKTKTKLNVVSDQIGTPTSAEFIANISSVLALRALAGENNLFGTYNLVPHGEVCWFEFAKWIVSQAYIMGMPLKLRPENIHPISSTDYPMIAKRPLNSRLDNKKLSTLFGDAYIKNWNEYKKKVLTALLQQEKYPV